MIVDQLQNWKKYFSNPVWKTIFHTLCALHEETPEGDTKIAGADVILKIFSYATLDADDENARPESHRKYFDIHTSILHPERIDWYPASSLTVARPYDATEDEIVYLRPRIAPASILMPPGLFVLFGPDDAHRPRLHPVSRPEQVKKAVVKVPVDISF